ncbi:MAG: hypothetical protein ACHQK9_12495 [Reyranellales bacterium]
MVIAALAVTSFAASALQTWATARNVGFDELPASDVAKHDSPTREPVDGRPIHQGRSRDQSHDRVTVGLSI